MSEKVTPCNLANIGSSKPKCPIMERLYKRLGREYSPSGDIDCVGMGEVGCAGGFSKADGRLYRWKQRFKRYINSKIL